MNFIVSNKVIFKQINQLAQANLVSNHSKYNHLFLSGSFYKYSLIKSKKGYLPAMLLRNVSISHEKSTNASLRFNNFWILIYSSLAQIGQLKNRLKLHFQMTIKTCQTKTKRYYYIIKYVSDVKLARKHNLPTLPVKFADLDGVIILNNLKEIKLDYQMSNYLASYSRWLCNYLKRFSHISYLKYLAKQAKIYTPYSAILIRLNNAVDNLSLCQKTKYANNFAIKNMLKILRVNALLYLNSSKSFLKNKTKYHINELTNAIKKLKNNQYSISIKLINNTINKLKTKKFSAKSMQKIHTKQLKSLATYIETTKDKSNYKYSKVIKYLINHSDLDNFLNVKISNSIYRQNIKFASSIIKKLNINSNSKLLKKAIALLKANLDLDPNRILYQHTSINCEELLKIIKIHIN